MSVSESLTQGFQNWLIIEKGLSHNSVEAYMHDLGILNQYFDSLSLQPDPREVTVATLRDFLSWLQQFSFLASSQARILSGIRAFFDFLVHTRYTDQNPVSLLSAPRIARKLPEVLSVAEIDRMLASIDLSKPEGHRNKAIIETLYSCGLRVSELVNLKMTNLHAEQEYIRVVGKGNKERLVPIGSAALHEIGLYVENYRKHLQVAPADANVLFLNHYGRKMTRVMVFYIVRQAASLAEIGKTISPHTLRHSFATHMVEGGANLRVVQDILGHASITTTEIYTHLDTSFLRDTLYSCHPLYRK